MTAKEIREKSNTELLQEIEVLKNEFFGLRLQQATGQLANTACMRTMKKTIARVKTVMIERELGSQDQGESLNYRKI